MRHGEVYRQSHISMIHDYSSDILTAMTDIALKSRIKKAVDKMPREKLASVADYIAFLSRPTLAERLKVAERDARKGNLTPWRAVRKDV